MVGVEKLEEGAVHRVGELVDLDHLLVVLVPVGLEHAPEVFAPAQRVCVMTDGGMWVVSIFVR